MESPNPVDDGACNGALQQQKELLTQTREAALASAQRTLAAQEAELSSIAAERNRLKRVAVAPAAAGPPSLKGNAHCQPAPESPTARLAALLRKKVQQKAADPSPSIPKWMSDEQYAELGYPENDPKFKDKAYVDELLRKEMTDPRENGNLARTADNPNFWWAASRKPINRMLLRSEEHWNMRRGVWSEQYKTVCEMNDKRQALADLIEDCSSATRRLVTPILKHKCTEIVLLQLLEESELHELDFRELIEREETQAELKALRLRLDGEEGDEAAASILRELECRMSDQQSQRSIQQQDSRERTICDVTLLGQVLNWGEKCKKDGTLAWKEGDFEEAHSSWKMADMVLRRFAASEEHDAENSWLFEMHHAVLKNLSQVCMKLGHWNDALDAADRALVIDDSDPKAWFRRACALEGLSRLHEAEDAFQRITRLAVGRPDHDRLCKDVERKLKQCAALRSSAAKMESRMFGRALAGAVFADQRQDSMEGAEPSAPSHARPLPPAGSEQHAQSAEGASVRAREVVLPRDSVIELLADLKEAYDDTAFQEQVLKLSRDMRGSLDDFLIHHRRLAFERERPILLRWGFDTSLEGADAMKEAIQEHLLGKTLAVESVVETRASKGTAGVEALLRPVVGGNFFDHAQDTCKMLYGCMYCVICD